MCSLPQFERGRLGVLRSGAVALLRIFVLGVGLLLPAVLRAQTAPPGAVARIEGADVSVEGGGVAAANISGAGGVSYVFNRRLLTVHPGRAEVRIAGGGEGGFCRA